MICCGDINPLCIPRVEGLIKGATLAWYCECANYFYPAINYPFIHYKERFTVYCFSH